MRNQKSGLGKGVRGAQHHLSRLLETQGRSTDNTTDINAIQCDEDEVWSQYTVYIPPSVNLSEAAMYDHLVPIESRRTTISQRIPEQTPEMDKICCMMRQSLESAVPDGQVISPQELV